MRSNEIFTFDIFRRIHTFYKHVSSGLKTILANHNDTLDRPKSINTVVFSFRRRVCTLGSEIL